MDGLNEYFGVFFFVRVEVDLNKVFCNLFVIYGMDCIFCCVGGINDLRL